MCVYFKIIIILISNIDTLFLFERDDNLLIADQNFKHFSLSTHVLFMSQSLHSHSFRCHSVYGEVIVLRNSKIVLFIFLNLTNMNVIYNIFIFGLFVYQIFLNSTLFSPLKSDINLFCI